MKMKKKNLQKETFHTDTKGYLKEGAEDWVRGCPDWHEAPKADDPQTSPCGQMRI